MTRADAEILIKKIHEYIVATVDVMSDPCTEYYQRQDIAQEALINILMLLPLEARNYNV